MIFRFILLNIEAHFHYHLRNTILDEDSLNIHLNINYTGFFRFKRPQLNGR